MMIFKLTRYFSSLAKWNMHIYIYIYIFHRLLSMLSIYLYFPLDMYILVAYDRLFQRDLLLLTYFCILFFSLSVHPPINKLK